MSISLLFILIIALMAAGAPCFIRSITWNRFNKQIKNEQYEQALQTLRSRVYRTMFGTFDSDWNQLKLYLQTNDAIHIEQKTNELLANKLTKDQRHQVANSVYFYFLDKENKDMARKLLDQLSLCTEADEYRYDQIMYRVLIEKKSEDIEKVEALIKENTNVKEKGLLQYLLGLQYMYRNDTKQAQMYFNRAKSNLKGTPYHKKIKKLMEA